MNPGQKLGRWPLCNPWLNLPYFKLFLSRLLARGLNFAKWKRLATWNQGGTSTVSYHTIHNRHSNQSWNPYPMLWVQYEVDTVKMCAYFRGSKVQSHFQKKKFWSGFRGWKTQRLSRFHGIFNRVYRARTCGVWVSTCPLCRRSTVEKLEKLKKLSIYTSWYHRP